VNPEVLEAKHTRPGNASGDVNPEGHVVGGRSGERGEDSVGEDFIPAQVDEEPVKALEGGMGPPIRPSKASIDERELDEAHGVDAIVKGFSFSQPESVIVFFVGISYHIKIAPDDPRVGGRRSKSTQLIQEANSVVRGGRGIDVGSKEGEGSGGGGEVNGKSVGGGGGAEEGEGR
jgi:hypothetical protein